MQSFRQSFKDQTILYIFVGVLFLVGVLFGALMVNALSLEQQQDMARYLNHFFINVQDGGGLTDSSSFWNIAAVHLKWIGLIWILGLSVIGLPGILILDFLKGFSSALQSVTWLDSIPGRDCCSRWCRLPRKMCWSSPCS